MSYKTKKITVLKQEVAPEDLDDLSVESESSNIVKSRKPKTKVEQPTNEPDYKALYEATLPKPSKMPVETAVNEILDIPEQKPAKPKRQLTEKQKEALNKGREKARQILNEKNNQIQQAKEEKKRQKAEYLQRLKEQEEEEYNKKLIKKAEALKKRQAKKKALLDEIEDEPEEEYPVRRQAPVRAQQQVRQQAQVRQAPQQPPKPRHPFENFFIV